MSHSDDIFEDHRPALASLAYRMLGSLADVDDVLQEAYLRWNCATIATAFNRRGLISSRS